MSETYTTYGIGPDKQFDELQALRDERDRLRRALEDIRDSIGHGALNVNWIKQYAEAALTPAGGGQREQYHPAFDEYGEHRQPTGLGDL